MTVDHLHGQASGTLYRRTQLSPASRAAAAATAAHPEHAERKPCSSTPPPPPPPPTTPTRSRPGPYQVYKLHTSPLPPTASSLSSSSSSLPSSAAFSLQPRHPKRAAERDEPATAATEMVRLPLLLRLPNKLRRRARRNRIMALLILLSLLLIPVTVCLYVVYRPPALLIRYMMSRFPDVLWHVDTTRKMIALTIDDAPSQHTSDILRVLRENQAHATFFVIGSQAQGQAREGILRDLVLGGHELGNHAWRDEGSRALSDEQLRAEISGVKDIIHHAYTDEGEQPPPNYFRPGGGFFSTRMRALADRLGYRIVLGDVYPHDPQIPWPRLNSWHVLSMVRPGSIVVCHDRRSWTVPMLQTVLPELRRRGYEVVTVSRLLSEGEKHPIKPRGSPAASGG